MTENQKTAVQRPYTGKDTAIGLLIALGIGVLGLVLLPFSVTKIGFIWLPALCLLLTRRGAVPAYAAAVLLTLDSWILLGSPVCWLAGLVLIGSLVALTLVLRPGYSFTEQLLYGGLGMLVMILLAAVLFNRFVGDVVDTVIDTLHGMFTMTPEITAAFNQSFAQLYGEEFSMDTVLYVLEESMRTSLPANVMTYCVYGTALAVFASRKRASTMGMPELVGAKEDLTRWAMPRFSARVLGGAALVCFLISLTGQEKLTPVANALWQLFIALFSLHGAASLAFMMRIRGTGTVWRYLILALLLLLLPLALALTALAERVMPTPRTLTGDGRKTVIVTRRRDGEDSEGETEMHELDEEELPEFMRRMFEREIKLKKEQQEARKQGKKNDDDSNDHHDDDPNGNA